MERRGRRPTPATSTRVCLPHRNCALPQPHLDFPTHSSIIEPSTDASFSSPQAGSPRYRYLQPCHVHPELVRQRYVFTSQVLFTRIILISRPDIFERVATEASKLAAYNKKSTISSREIQTSVRLILPGELAKHAVSEGTKAVTKYSSSGK